MGTSRHLRTDLQHHGVSTFAERHAASRLVAQSVSSRGVRRGWAIIPRFIVWLLFMASGLVVIPLGIAMCIAYFPGGLPVLLGWLDWAGGVHTWMLGRTSFLGAPMVPPPPSVEVHQELEDRSRVCPACGYECVSETGTPSQCPSCTHLFDIERVEVPMSPSVTRRQQLGYPQRSSGMISHLCQVCGHRWADQVVNPQQCPNSYCGAALTDSDGPS